MKLSRTVEYAVQALIQLAQSPPNVPVPCSRIASEGRMPERFLLQILRTLVTQGILKSTRGVDGGYSLERPADQISLLEIVEIVDGSLEASRAEATAADATKLDAAMSRVTQTVRRELASVRLSQLLPSKA